MGLTGSGRFFTHFPPITRRHAAAGCARQHADSLRINEMQSVSMNLAADDTSNFVVVVRQSFQLIVNPNKQACNRFAKDFKRENKFSRKRGEGAGAWVKKPRGVFALDFRRQVFLSQSGGCQ